MVISAKGQTYTLVYNTWKLMETEKTIGKISHLFLQTFRVVANK